MLEIVFDRLVRIMSTSLRNFTNDNVEVSHRQRRVSLRFGDYLELGAPAGDVRCVQGQRSGKTTA